MIYDRSEVTPDSILRIANPVFEGYAKLISAEGDMFTEMESDYSKVIVQQRWRIQFLPPNPELQLSPGERMTQELQHERITHRVIRFNAGCFTNAYREFGGTTELDVPDRDNLADEFVDNCF